MQIRDQIKKEKIEKLQKEKLDKETNELTF